MLGEGAWLWGASRMTASSKRLVVRMLAAGLCRRGGCFVVRTWVAAAGFELIVSTVVSCFRLDGYLAFGVVVGVVLSLRVASV
jgi:hypothetical protein